MIEVVIGDITGLAVDCIVNAANSRLMGGAGVDGAIHRGAGPRLVDECRRIGGCPTGDARMTGGYDLAARHVVHAVGPVWNGGMEGEDELLASCYRRSFELAEAAGARSIAFPAISTGAYGFPKERAAVIAVREMTAREDRFERIIACCFSEADAAFYRRLLPAAHLGPRPDRDDHKMYPIMISKRQSDPFKRGAAPISVSGSQIRQLIEAWHGIRVSDVRSEDIARTDDLAARTVAAAAESLTLRDQPSRFRSVLVASDERAD